MSELIFQDRLPDALAQADNLPSLPAVAVEVLRLSRDDDASLQDLAEVLSRDPVLSSRLLRLANSARFNLGQEVTTLQRATTVLGMKTVRMTALSFSLAASLPRAGKGEFDFVSYWRRSLVAAVAAQSLAARVDRGDAEEAFLGGLLSRLGQLAMVRCLPGPYGEVLRRADGRQPTLAMENEVLGFHHAEVGGALLEQWRLPALITQAVAYLLRVDQLPAQSDARVRSLCQTLAVADLVAALTCGESEAKGLVLSRIYDRAEAFFSLDQQAVDTYLSELEPSIAAAAEMLQIELPEALDHQTILDQARTQIVELSLSASADLHAAERRASTLEARNRQLHDQAHTDALTGLPNRAAFDASLAQEIDLMRGSEPPRSMGLLLFDLDRFKSLNDTYGHLAGDEVLRRVGQVLAEVTRETDLCARYGGEEFALIVPSITPEYLEAMAERVREAVASTVVEWEGVCLEVTVSVGGACLTRVSAGARSSSDGTALIKMADDRLYAAKESGRNRCEIAARELVLG